MSGENPVKIASDNRCIPREMDAPGFRGFICGVPHAWDADAVQGHINWRSAEFSVGMAFWKGYSGSPFEDDDYNLFFVPSNGACLTQGNSMVPGTHERALDVEFSAAETIHRYSAPGWWRDLRYAVERGEHGPASHFVSRGQGLPAVLIGLVGIDTQHGGYAEIHPLFAMAIRIRRDSGTHEETWAYMIRNSGNEGYCSSSIHYLLTPDNRVTLRIPGATIDVPGKSKEYSLGGATQSIVSTPDGVCIVANLGDPLSRWAPVDPRTRPAVYGEVVVNTPEDPFSAQQFQVPVKAKMAPEEEEAHVRVAHSLSREAAFAGSIAHLSQYKSGASYAGVPPTGPRNPVTLLGPTDASQVDIAVRDSQQKLLHEVYKRVGEERAKRLALRLWRVFGSGH